MFSAFQSTKDQRFIGWATFRDSINAGTRIDQAVADARRTPRAAGAVDFPRFGIWRLLASNNRELGRSAAAYPSFEAARGDVVRLQNRINDVVIVGVRGTTSSQYGWLATLDNVPVITSGRWFGASSTALHSAVTTLAAFETATVSEEVWPGGRAGERAGKSTQRGAVSASAPW